jgi:hypothetical protein
VSANKRELLDRECGLTFSWRSPESSGWGTFSAVVVVSLLATGFFGAVRVRIMPPPRIIERHAGIVLVPESAEGASWAISVDEQGPFPAKFDVVKNETFQAVEKACMSASRQRSRYAPKLRDLPQETQIPEVAVSLRGERVFPKEVAELAAKSATPIPPLAPSLLLLSNYSGSAKLGELPAFEGEIPPEIAAKPWRFMIEIGPNGRVLQHQPIEAGADEVTKNALLRLENWIGQLRFIVSGKPGWIGVEVTFNRSR